MRALERLVMQALAQYVDRFHIVYCTANTLKTAKESCDIFGQPFLVEKCLKHIAASFISMGNASSVRMINWSTTHGDQLLACCL